MNQAIEKNIDQTLFEPLSEQNVDEMAEILRRNLGIFDEVGSVLASAFRRVANLASSYGPENESTYFVLINKSSRKIIGGVGVGPLAGLPVSEGVGEIRELVIEEDFRGQGFGKKLIKQALDHAKSIGFFRIYLETTPQMVSARHLFEKFGFRRVEENKPEQLNNPQPTYYLLESIDG